MTASHVSGPVIVYGVPQSATATNTNPDAGPSVTYGGDALFDIRYPYGPGSNQSLLASGLRSPPSVRGVTNYPYVCLVDAIPATGGGTVGTITIGQTAGVLTTNNTTWGVNGSLSIIPNGSAYTTANQVTVCGLDVGFGSCTLVSGTTAATSFVASDGLGTASLQVGQPIVISGGASATAPLFTYVSAIVSSTAFTLANAAGVSASARPVGSAHPSLLSPDPYNTIGAAYIFDPRQGLSRVLDYVSSSAGDTTQTITTVGYDIYGVLMTETISLNGTNHIPGLKAFKYVKTITASATCAGTITVTNSRNSAGLDLFGINMRSIQWEYMNIFYNGAFVSSNSGWTAAITTSPSTALLADVRGTYAVQTNAPNGTAPATGRRLAIFQSVRQYDLATATIANPAPLFGVTQV